MGVAPTSPAPRPTPPAGAQSPSSGKITYLRVHQTDVAVDDVIEDTSGVRWLITHIDDHRNGFGHLSRIVTMQRVGTTETTTATWSHFVRDETVVAGPKLAAANANRSLVRHVPSHNRWHWNRQQIASAS